jgi:hypothetical protein
MPPRNIAAKKAVFALLLVVIVCFAGPGQTAAQDAPSPEQERFSNLEKSIPDEPAARFRRLGELAQVAYDAGDLNKAENYADELLSSAPHYAGDWAYGDAIFTGNTVAGLVAIKRDHNLSQAEGYLLASGRTPGSPRLDSFGPGMRLAQELLTAGERTAVLDFLRECQSFWKMGDARLASWSEAIRAGQAPDFGPNLKY